MFTGTSDGRVVKLENGEIETIARFGSGPCSKLVMPHSESCPFPPDVTFSVGELLTIWQTGHAVVSPWFLIVGWSSGLGVPTRALGCHSDVFAFQLGIGHVTE